MCNRDVHTVKGKTMSHSNNSVTDEPSPQEPIPPQPLFPRLKGETPRAFGAFVAWFQLGQNRSHQKVADALGEGLPTIKNWASKYNWSHRLQAFSSNLVQQEAAAAVEHRKQHAADWAWRLEAFREQEWDAAQKLLAAACCFLECFADADIQKMTLAQASRAIRVSSQMGRAALTGIEAPPSAEPVLSPVQEQMLDALRRLSEPDLHSPSPMPGPDLAPPVQVPGGVSQIH
jgi:hypothetical protein